MENQKNTAYCSSEEEEQHSCKQQLQRSIVKSYHEALNKPPDTLKEKNLEFIGSILGRTVKNSISFWEELSPNSGQAEVPERVMFLCIF